MGTMTRMAKNRQNILKILLWTLTVLAAVKMILAGVGLDEEYQVVMAYRNVMGDRLFLEMWEPHQSSAFLCAFLMKLYIKLFGGTDFVVIYLRLCGTLFHIGVSVYFGRVMGRIVGREGGALLALIYFNTIPKQIMLPEFGIMQAWSYTLLSLFLIQYYGYRQKKRYLVFMALAMAFNVLSYPSCLILFPFVLFVIARLSEKDRWRDMGIFTLVCLVCGAGYLFFLFHYLTPAKLLETLSFIVSGDVTHSLTFADKLLTFLRQGIFVGILWAACRIAAAMVSKWKKLERISVECLTIMMACAVELVYWVVLDLGYESMSIHLVAVTLAGWSAYADMRGERADIGVRGEKSDAGVRDERADIGMCDEKSDACGERIMRLLRYSIVGSILSLLAVLYLTDLNLIESLPHVMPAALFGGALFTLRCVGHSAPQKAVKWVYAALLVWCFTALIGKGYTLRGGGYNNVLQSSGILRHGPAAGTISFYINSYIYNCDYEDWQTYVKDGDRVLIMVDQTLNLGTIQYLFKDVEISHFSIVNPTAYDERLLEYWEMYPTKAPNVIIVDCWYGQLMTDEEGWLMQYIENEFGYTQMDDGRYIRIYRK
ncbi:MAG: hypothetical protein NC417_10275 [Candidatus Gastranaerophilales bacterium]|nr:hypothetical protein [Candidatus Gastranaerophilales bacterium]